MAFVTKETLKQDAEKAEGLLDKPKEEGTPAEPVGEAPPVEAPPEEPVKPVEEPQNHELAKATTEISDLKEKLNTSNSRYLTLQGMFNKLSDDMKELKASKAEAGNPAPVEPVAPVVKSETLEKLEADYGKEILPDLTTIITNAVNNALDAKLKAHGERVAKVEEVQGQTVKEVFFTTLEKLVPDWKKLNGWADDGIPQDPKWAEFLLTIAPGTTKTYDKVLNEGYSAYNADAVAKVFNYFKQLNTSTEPPKEDPKPKPSDAVEKLVDPNTGGTSGVPTDNNKKPTYTMKEIDKFFNSITRGQFQGTSEEKAQLTAMYEDAMHEGRVVE